MADEFTDDGLGGSVPVEGATLELEPDDAPEDEPLGFPYAAEQAADTPPPAAEAPAAPAEEPPADDPIAVWGSKEAAEYAASKGWREPSDATREARRLEGELTRQRQGIAPNGDMQALQEQNANLAALVAELRAGREAAFAEMEVPEEVPMIDWRRAVDHPEFDLGEVMDYTTRTWLPAIIHQEVQRAIQPIVEQQIRPIAETVQPLAKDAAVNRATQEALAVKAEYGDDMFLKLGTRAEEVYSSNPAMGLRAAFAVAEREHNQRLQAQAARDRAANGGNVGGQRAAAPVRQEQDMGQIMRDAIRNAGRVRRTDGLS